MKIIGCGTIDGTATVSTSDKTTGRQYISTGFLMNSVFDE
jgi:hypothetical protein